jgi:hypothetical protein
MSIEKVCVDGATYYFPDPDGSMCASLVSRDERESFLLDISRGRINLAKATYQNRSRKVIILLRLDIEGTTHTNPDGHRIPTPHLHVYREGFGDKWAIPVPSGDFTNTSDLFQSMEDFMTYCNITQPPNIERRLF